MILSQPGSMSRTKPLQKVQPQLNRHRHEQADDLSAGLPGAIGDRKPCLNLVSVRRIRMNDVPIERALGAHRELES